MSTVKVEQQRPAVDTEAEYDSVLVAFDEHGFDPQVMATAVRMAARRRRGIHVLVTISVPASSPVGAELPELEAAAASILEEARVQGGRRVTGHVEKLRAGQTGPAHRRHGPRAARRRDRDADGPDRRQLLPQRWRRCCANGRAG